MQSTNVLSVTVDHILSAIYIDGVQIPPSTLINSDVWTAADQVQLSDTLKVIAVLGTGNQDGHEAILGSDSNGLVWTNGSWKCNSVYFDGWTNITFDDRTWPNAKEIQLNAGSSRPEQPSVKADAYWIWTTNEYDTPVYCRVNVNLGRKAHFIKSSVLT